MKKILMHMNFKRFFSVELKGKKDSSSDSGTPELYYDTNRLLYPGRGKRCHWSGGDRNRCAASGSFQGQSL